jgi:hypothetical protein
LQLCCLCLSRNVLFWSSSLRARWQGVNASKAATVSISSDESYYHNLCK